MILKSLEMQGFKSFPDKTVLEFNKGITAVVGPNGSGKSNISDAVRWVLGEQSTKNLRGSKMEDVVFMGTDLRKAKGYAEVTLRFDNKDRTLSKDTDEVSVTRRYYRSGESEYIINGENARLRDINELFMDTGLGRDGYSIVGQGKIAEMVSSKAAERRDMLEEAAGISHFRYRRNDANKRLAAAEENLLRLRDILTELEGRVGPLKTQSEKAQKFLVLAEEKKQLEIGTWLYTIDRTNDRLREQEHKIATAEAGHKAAADELEIIGEKIDSAAEKTREINVQIEEIRNAAAHFEEQASALDAQARVEENSVLHNTEAMERLKADKLSENETEQHLEERIAECRATAEQSEQAAANLQAELSALAAEQDKNTGDAAQYSEAASALSAEVSALSVAIADNRVTAETANSSVEEIRTRIAAIEAQLGGRQDTYETYKQNKEKALSALNDCLETIQSVQNAMDGYSMRFESRAKKAETIKQNIEEKEREVHKTADRIRLLSDLEKNMEGYQGAVKAVMRESARGALRGIHGPLSQLITVKPKYTAAIETALGAAIQNIVTDTENDAKRAIQFLKESRAGRATFLPIAAIRAREFTEKGLDDQYGFVSMAADLVTTDKQYTEIIRAQLARTVVAEDMDAAIAIAKKYNYRFRIVTLDGQVINAGGSMTGGSRTQNAGILSRGNEIEKLQKDLNAAQTELATMQSDYKLFTEDLAAARAEMEGAQGDLLRANEEKIRCEGELKLAEEQLSSVSGTVRELAEEKEMLEHRIDTVLENAAAAREALETQTAELREKEQALEKLTGDREALAAARESLSQKASELRLQIMALEKDAQSARDEMQHLENRKLSHTDKQGSLDSEIAAYEAKNAELLQNIENLKANAAALRENNGASRAQIDELLTQRDTLEKETNDLRTLERAKSVERENLSGELARLEERKIAMRKEYDDLTAKLFEEYSLTRREAAALEIEIEDFSAANKRLNELKGQIRALGSVNVSAIEEYKEVSERYEFMSEQISDVERSRDELNKLIRELTDNMAQQFRDKFRLINTAFGETFSELFGGGRAELLLSDEHDILESDIEIKVQPPGKNLKSIEPLSGGEKGLAAISLLFAILKVTPAPFCIFDEVEAALDDVNVSRYAQYVRRMTKNTQFILITHRRGTMEEADVLYGVTMQESGVSKLLELKTAEMAKQLGLA
ncbi:MAG: chromosome segregation protein SMC [Candidatus Fimenecus sp.]